MNSAKSSGNEIISAALFLLFSQSTGGQAGIVKSEGVAGALRQASTGRIVFTARSVPVESLEAVHARRIDDTMEQYILPAVPR